MLIYSPHIGSRLQYVFDYLFNQRLGLNYVLESSQENFINATGPKINYSEDILPDAINVYPEGLLFESSIRKTKPQLIPLENNLELYSVSESGFYSFDIFSAIFWMLSRYEEYQEFKGDRFGRFTIKDSVLGAADALHRPLVDEWVYRFRQELNEKYPDLDIKKEAFSVVPTIDIDSPWCYKHKGIWRTIVGSLRDLLKGNFSLLPDRFKVLLSIKSDPWDQFSFLQKVCSKWGVEPIFFYLVGSFGRHDKTVSSKKSSFKKLIKQTSSFARIGLHTSFNSVGKLNLIEKEKERLSTIIGSKVDINRQHYLKITFPTYFEQMIDVGIQKDYSLGFADGVGFRAGTSRSFLFYNLLEEKSTNLELHPFSVMDVSLKNYMQLNPDEALLLVKEIIDSLKKVNGTFVSLWHNESLSNYHEWEGWQYVYSEILDYALKDSK